MLTILVAALLSVDLVDAAGFQIGRTVKTSSGDITGQPSSWKPEVSEYLGIRYAQPPVGKLRFAAPIALKAAGEAVNATKYVRNLSYIDSSDQPQGPSCITKIPSSSVPLLSAMGVQIGPQSEDCLYLNVWTKPQTGDKKKAVMIWFDGRAFIVGDSSNTAYNGALLADENDVVVVNMNYRLGVFGFPNVRNMPDANFGLRDQRLVVEWVRDNIASFGGDPSRITLFGQSAGSISVDKHAFAWPHDPIAHAIILQSGTAGDHAGRVSSTSWTNGVSLLRCGDANTDVDAMLACARRKSAEEVADAFSRFELGPSTDNRTAYRSYVAPLEQGRFARVPALIGHTAAEWDTYDRRSIFPDSAPGARKVDDTPLRKVVESFLVCRAGRTAKARAALGLPTWLYVYGGDFPNQRTAPELKTEPWHGSEVGLVFGTDSLVRKAPDSPEQAELGKKMREAWTTFAKDPVTGLDKLKWPRYDPSASTVVTIGGKDSSKISFGSPAGYEPTCTTLDFGNWLINVLTTKP